MIKPHLSTHQKGVSALVILALIFASMGIFARYLSTSFTTMQQVYLRLSAAIIWGFILFWQRHSLFKTEDGLL